MADQQVNIVLNAIDNTKKALNDLQNNLKGIDKETKTTSASFLSFRNILVGTAGIAFVALTKQIVDATTKFQDLRSNLISATGSIQDGGNAFNYLKKYAKESQFSVEELTGAYLTLYQNGVTPTEKTLRTLVTVAGEGSNKIETLTQLVNLFSKGSQDATIGVQALNVLLKNNIPVYDILREKLGGTTKSINGLFENSVTAQEALKALLDGLTERANKASNRTENLSTKLGILGKTVQETLASFGETKALNNFFESLTTALENNKPFLEFLGNIFAGIFTIANFILGTANKVFMEFFSIFAIYLNPLKDMASAIYDKLAPAFVWASGKIDSLVKSWEKLKNSLAIGMNAQNLIKVENTPMEMFGMGTLPEAKKQPDATQLEKIYATTRQELNKVIAGFTDLGDIISKGLVGGIKDFSKSIAESIVYGKSLQASFADIARNLLAKIIAGLIEEQLAKLALIALDEVAVLLGLKKLGIEKLITKEKRDQAEADGRTSGAESPEDLVKKQLESIFTKLWENVKTIFSDIFSSVQGIFSSMGEFANSIFGDIGSNIGSLLETLGSSVGDIFSSIGSALMDMISGLSGGGGGGGFLGSILNIGSSFFGGGGGMPDLPMGMYAEGGSVKGGMPVTVGERGRELFVPKTDGTIVPNQDLNTSGQNITFNIQANDVKGIKELLINNRATIINLVNQGANRKGKNSVV
jgi:hypothetical protein